METRVLTKKQNGKTERTERAARRYAEACKRLEELLKQRNKVLHRLADGAMVAITGTTGTAIVIEFDVGDAQGYLERVDKLTPRISAAMDDVNRYAEEAGKPQVQWGKVDPRDV